MPVAGAQRSEPPWKVGHGPGSRGLCNRGVPPPPAPASRELVTEFAAVLYLADGLKNACAVRGALRHRGMQTGGRRSGGITGTSSCLLAGLPARSQSERAALFRSVRM